MTSGTQLPDEIVFAEGVSVDDVISGMRKVNESLDRGGKTGFAWDFPAQRSTDIFDQIDTLSVGIRGQVGTLIWHDATGGYVPTGGDDVRGVDYFIGGHHHGAFQDADGIDLPIDRVFEALREYARTGTRPTGVEWVARDE